MLPDNSIFEAVLPDRAIVLGLKLHPFSLGHYMLLYKHRNAFVCDETTTATREDLIFACLVCSMTFDEFNAWLDRPAIGLLGKAVEFARFCTCCSSRAELIAAMAGNRVLLDVVRWGRKIGLFNLTEKVALFREYFDQSTKEPKYWIERESTRQPGGHWCEDVFITLTGCCGFTREQALNMPVREALMHFFTYAQTQGAVTLMRDEEIEEVASGS